MNHHTKTTVVCSNPVFRCGSSRMDHRTTFHVRVGLAQVRPNYVKLHGPQSGASFRFYLKNPHPRPIPLLSYPVSIFSKFRNSKFTCILSACQPTSLSVVRPSLPVLGAWFQNFYITQVITSDLQNC